VLRPFSVPSKVASPKGYSIPQAKLPKTPQVPHTQEVPPYTRSQTSPKKGARRGFLPPLLGPGWLDMASSPSPHEPSHTSRIEDGSAVSCPDSPSAPIQSLSLAAAPRSWSEVESPGRGPQRGPVAQDMESKFLLCLRPVSVPLPAPASGPVSASASAVAPVPASASASVSISVPGRSVALMIRG
jgi:hypothetical protein